MKAAVYARVSSDSQDVDLSISAQLRAVRDYANKQGYEIVREYVDEAESGRNASRPAFREMIGIAKTNNPSFTVILVWKLNRFSRSRVDSVTYKTLLKSKGIRVISINEYLDESPSGQLLEGIIESVDEFYSANLGQDIKQGLRENAERGFYSIGRAPYGLRKVPIKDGVKTRYKLEPDPEDSISIKVVRRIFEMALKRIGCKEIARDLNREGLYSSTGQRWMKTTIHKILTNEVYTDTLVWGRSSIRDLPVIRVDNAWPAIVDKSIFDQAKSLLKERAPISLHPKRVASRYLLSGLARCGHCGKALVGQDAKSGQFTYYVCGTLLKKGAGSCPNRYLNSQQFESLVIEKIKEHILTIENLTKLVHIVNEEMDSLVPEYRQRLDSIIDEIADVDRRLERLYDALETGKIQLADLAPRIQQLRQRRERLQAARWEMEQQLSDKRVELADSETVARYVADLHDLLNESSLVERKSFVRSFVKEVKVTGNEALLTYTIPMLPRGIIEEKLPVLSIVHDGGAGVTIGRTFQLEFSLAM